jgi:ATP-dependent Clp protease ATP-binding subunit ClpB
LAKTLAKELFEDSNAFVRLDMSEFQDKASANKFIGASPGYVGYNDGAQLVNAIERRQGKGGLVVLFDEIEKADPEILTILLSLFDEGRITNNKGTTFICTDMVCIMTSNLGGDTIRRLFEEAAPGESPAPHSLLRTIQPELKAHFKRDEFIGRIDGVIPFLPFTPEEIVEMIESGLEAYRTVAAEKHHFELTWDESIIKFIAGEYNAAYGARSIRSAISALVVPELSELTLSDSSLHHSLVHMIADVQNRKVLLDVKHYAPGDGVVK